MEEIILKAVVEAACNLVRDASRDEIANYRRSQTAKTSTDSDASVESANLVEGTHEEALLTFEMEPSDVVAAISLHVASKAAWGSKLKVSDLRTSKETKDVFVHLSLYVYPRSTKSDASDEVITIPFDNISHQISNHCLLLGPAGAGKSSSMRFLYQQVAGNLKSAYGGVIVILFRELSEVYSANRTQSVYGGRSVLYEELSLILGIKISFTEKSAKDPERIREDIAKRALLHLVDSLKLVMILDGLDEVSLPELRSEIVSNLKELSARLRRSRIVITSRTGVIDTSFEHIDVYEIAPLDDDQIGQFAKRWLQDEKLALDFVGQLNASPFKDVSLRPLFLGHLCTIYQRTKRIPEKPKSVYRKAVTLYLEDWDHQNDVQRMSQYAQLDVDRKFEFLAALSYALTTWYQATVFTTEMLIESYSMLHQDFRLPQREAFQVLRELESQTGLFLQTSSTQYEFAHKSIQEFLTASYINSLPNILKVESAFGRMPNEFAIAISLSTRPTDALYAVVMHAYLTPPMSRRSFILQLIDRLALERPDLALEPITAALIACCFSMLLADSEKEKVLDPNPDVFQAIEKMEAIIGNRNVMNLLMDHFKLVQGISAESRPFATIEIYRLIDGYDVPSRLEAKHSWLRAEPRTSGLDS